MTHILVSGQDPSSGRCKNYTPFPRPKFLSSVLNLGVIPLPGRVPLDPIVLYYCMVTNLCDGS